VKLIEKAKLSHEDKIPLAFIVVTRVDFSEGISAKIAKIYQSLAGASVVRERIIFERMKLSSGIFEIYFSLDKEMHLVSHRLYVIVLRKLAASCE